MEPDYSEASRANDKIEGREETNYNEDGLRTVFEVFAIADLEDYGPAPYIVSIDQISMKVLGLYRNWSEDDDSLEELQHFVEYPFIPWRGAYPIGLPHLIGGLSGAATGALRALLDSAHIQNAPAALKLKGGKIGGQTKSPMPGDILEIEGGFGMDDIRKVAMPIPFNPPSPTLFSLLSFVVDAAKGVVRTSLDDLPDMQTDVPVGTTLARIEQGLVVFSAIHGRFHDSQTRMLDIVHRLNGLYLDDEDIENEVGEKLATRADFQGPMDVAPVSDPNIYSEVQRISQVQIIAQRADLKPQLYDQRKVEETLLTALKIPNGEQLLVPAATPKEQNAVNENVAASLGRPVVAFPEQDHLAHLYTHVAYMQSPNFGSLPIIAPRFIPLMLGHIAEHIALWYASAVFKSASGALRTDLGDFMRSMRDDSTAEERQEMDRMLNEAGMDALMQGGEAMKALPEIIGQAQQLMASFAPQGGDPFIAIENKKIDTKAKTDGERLQIEAQSDAETIKVKREKILADQQDAQAAEAAETLRNDADNSTATQLAVLHAMTGGTTRDARNPNPNPGR